MKIPSQAHRTSCLRAFTLIELLVVVSIIVILAGLTVGISGYVQGKAAVSKAETQIKLLEMKLEEYAADANGFPEVDDRKGLAVYMMLFGDGLGPDGILSTTEANSPQLTGIPSEGAKVYLAELDPRSNKQKMLRMQRGGDQAELIPEALVDPWGKEWRFRSGQQYNTMNPDFDLWSAGPDGKWDTQDDVRNW